MGSFRPREGVHGFQMLMVHPVLSAERTLKMSAIFFLVWPSDKILNSSGLTLNLTC